MTESPSTHTAQRLAIGHFLRDLLKVIKVVATYPPNNPLPNTLKQRLATDLLTLLDEHDEIRITVEADKLNWEHEVVYFDRSRDEALAALFFHTGITSFAFMPTMTASDLSRLIDVFRDYLNSAGRSSDLAAELWEANIGGFEIETVEDISLSIYDDEFDIEAYLRRSTDDADPDVVDSDVQRYLDLFREGIVQNEIDLGDSGQIETQDDDEDPGQDSDPSCGSADSNAGLSLTDVPTVTGAHDRSVSSQKPSPVHDTTLIFNDQISLSEEERRQVVALLAQDAGFDPAESTVALLKEMLNQEIEYGGFCESLKITEKITSGLIETGDLLQATRLIGYLDELRSALAATRQLWSEKISEVRDGFGSANRMRHLADALNRHSQIGAEELKRYLGNFGWQSLSAITDLLGDFNHRHHRETLCDFLAAAGKNNIDIVARTLYDKRWFVVRNSVMILGRIGDDKSLAHIRRAVNHEELRVRREVLVAIRSNLSKTATAMLRELVFDSDERLRGDALKTLLGRRSDSAFEALADILDDPRTTQLLSLGQQRQILIAYSALGGKDVLGYLKAMIIPVNPLGNHTLKERRMSAFLALAENSSPETEELLTGLSSSWRRDIRRQARLALTAWRQRRFGYE
jgi:HEAT repeat protein